MKTERLLVLCVAALSAACNGSIYRPTGIPRLAATSYVAFGDSMTFGVASTCPAGSPSSQVANNYPFVLQSDFAERYAPQQHNAVLNRGIGGETLAQGLARLDALLRDTRPQILLVLEGANDVNQGTHPTSMNQSIRGIVQTARARGADAYVGTLPPQRPGGCRAGAPAAVQPANEQIRAGALAEGAIVVDIYAAFGGTPGTLIGIDGLHPTDAGYQRIAQTFSDALRRRLED